MNLLIILVSSLESFPWRLEYSSSRMKFTSLSGVNRSASSSRPSYAYGHGHGKAGGLRFRRGGGARGGGARGGGGHGGGPPRGVSGGRQSEWWDDPRNDPKYEKWY